MKNIFLIILLAIFASPVFPQNIGVIEVNKDFTATLNFTDSIVFIVVGNNPSVGENKNKFYDIFQNGKNCIIRGNDPLAPETSITVKLDNEDIWFGRLKYGDSSKIFYDYTKDEIKKNDDNKMIEIGIAHGEEAKMKERLNSVLTDKVEYSSIGTIENGMTFQVANIKNDENYTYIKFIVNNGTGNEYLIEGIYFKYIEGKRKGINKNEVGIDKRIIPSIESPVKVVGAYKTTELGFVIPLFSVGKKGALIIQLLEANGTRNPQIKINGSALSSVKVFEQKPIDK